VVFRGIQHPRSLSFEKAVVLLQTNPPIAPVAPENEFVDYAIRHLLFHTRRGRTYRAIFTVAGDEVRILRVRGSGEPPVTPEDLATP
jgi:hypothetical protein